MFLKSPTQASLESLHDRHPIEYARHMVQRIQNHMATSSYGYGETRHEGDRPHYEYTCYGFLDHVLTTTHPKALKELLSLQKTYLSDLPTSFDHKILPYHLVMLGERLLHATPGWVSIQDTTHIQEGDILSYMDEGYTLSKTPSSLKDRTGTHVMFVDAVESLFLEDDHYVLRLWIIDATRQPHNRFDSRYHSDPDLRQTGIGRSPLILRYNHALNTFWIQWSKHGRLYKKLISILRLNNK